MMVAQLPRKGVPTIYSGGGHLFPWICNLGVWLLFPLTLLRLHSRPLNRHTPEALCAIGDQARINTAIWAEL